MMRTPGLVIPKDVHDVDDYASATDFLRENYSFIFAGPDGSTENLLIGTWSKKVRRSYVVKHGTSEDITKLPSATVRNKIKRAGIPHKSGPLKKKRKCPHRGESRGAIVRRLEEAGSAGEEGDTADPQAIEGEAAEGDY